MHGMSEIPTSVSDARQPFRSSKKTKIGMAMVCNALADDAAPLNGSCFQIDGVPDGIDIGALHIKRVFTFERPGCRPVPRQTGPGRA